VKACSWEEVGGSGTGDILESDYKIDHPNHGNTFYVRLPQAAKLLSDGGATIKISFQVAYAAGWFTGWCTKDDRHLVIKLGRSDEEVCQTILHEVGHAISQSAVSGGPYPGLTPPHDRFYTNDRGHFGPHCGEGIDDTYFKNASNRMDTAYASGKCKCVMYGGAVPSRTSEIINFCAKCVPFAKAAPITSMST
jgi:hypothetical protein